MVARLNLVLENLVVGGGVVLDERQCRPSYRVWDAHFGYACGLLRN
jgi:hypothetical protein